MTNDPRQALREGSMTSFQVVVVVICVVLNMVDGFDVLAMSFTAPLVAREWGVEPAALGVLLVRRPCRHGDGRDLHLADRRRDGPPRGHYPLHGHHEPRHVRIGGDQQCPRALGLPVRHGPRHRRSARERQHAACGVCADPLARFHHLDDGHRLSDRRDHRRIGLRLPRLGIWLAVRLPVRRRRLDGDAAVHHSLSARVARLHPDAPARERARPSQSRAAPSRETAPDSASGHFARRGRHESRRRRHRAPLPQGHRADDAVLFHADVQLLLRAVLDAEESRRSRLHGGARHPRAADDQPRRHRRRTPVRLRHATARTPARSHRGCWSLCSSSSWGTAQYKPVSCR